LPLFKLSIRNYKLPRPMNLINFTELHNIAYSEFSNPSNRKAAPQDFSDTIRNITAVRLFDLENAVTIEMTLGYRQK